MGLPILGSRERFFWSRDIDLVARGLFKGRDPPQEALRALDTRWIADGELNLDILTRDAERGFLDFGEL